MPKRKRGIIEVLEPTFKVLVAIDGTGDFSLDAQQRRLRGMAGVARVLVDDVIHDHPTYKYDVAVLEVVVRLGESVESVRHNIRTYHVDNISPRP